MKTCDCAATLKNSGTPDCQPLMSYAEMIIVVPKYGSDGSRNFIDLTDTLDQAYFDAKINAEDPRDRWFPIPRIKNATSTKADSTFQEFEDASKAFIRDGKRSWTMLIPKQTPQLLGQLQSFRCAEFGVYIVDKTKNLIGSLEAENELYPIIVDENSWNPVLSFATATTIQLINLSFDFDLTQEDSDLQMITATELGSVNLLNLKGLLDVVSTISSISTTDFTAALKVKGYGTPLSPIVVTGLVITDFVSSNSGTPGKVYNETDALDVTITSVVESPDGTYDINFAAQGSGEIIVLDFVKAGFDSALVEANKITIP